MKLKLLEWFEKWYKRCCDWGLEWPLKPKDGPYLGASAPLWTNPFRVVFFLNSIFNLVLCVTFTLLNVFVNRFNSGCPFQDAFFDLSLFIMLFNSILNILISSRSAATDKQWSRNLTLMLAFSVILVLFFFALLSSAAGGGCGKQEMNDLSIVLAILNVVVAGIQFAIATFCCMRFYFSNRYLAYAIDEDPVETI
mmetsp:Transcript_8691/g.16975  ORF Transcript_8691/g.16975 Transcript_8691/m.16975 type:complete len:195 (+) Transcript_8691:20-604(+)